MSIKNESIKDEAIRLAKQAKTASRQLAPISSAEKDRALHLMADQLEAQNHYLVAENKKDLDAAERAGISEAIVDRIALDASRVWAMAKGLREVAALPDPVREVVKMWRRPNGLQVGKMRIPLGVIAIIYEARPNVTADAAAQVVGVEIDGKRVSEELLNNNRGLSAWTLLYQNPPAEGVDLTLEVKGTEPLTITVRAETPGLPTIPGRSYQDRPPDMMTQHEEEDMTLVRKSFTFTTRP